MRVSFISGMMIFLLWVAAQGETDWRQFLGPERNGSIRDDSFAKGWLKGGIRERWRVKIGEGYSGIVVLGDRLFTMDSDGKDEFVVALSVADGRELWRYRTGVSPHNVYGGYGPRVTPSVDSDLLFTVSAGGDLLTLKADSGDLVWKRGLVDDLGWRPPAEGTSCSPLVQDGRIYLINGGTGGRTIAAFDRQTGKTLWTSQEDRPSYSSPVRWDYKGVHQVLFLTGSNLFSVQASTGELLWKYRWPTYDFVNVTTPLIVAPDRVFVSSGYDQGAVMLRIHLSVDGSLQVEEVWRNREMKNHFNNSVYQSGTLIGFDHTILKAMEAESGATLWRESGFGKGSVILTGEYLLILSESGDLICGRAQRDGLKVLKQVKAMKGKCWTPPSISRGCLFLRNPSEVVCLSAA